MNSHQHCTGLTTDTPLVQVEGLIGRPVEKGGLIPYWPSFAFAQIFISDGWRCGIQYYTVNQVLVKDIKAETFTFPSVCSCLRLNKKEYIPY